LKAFLKIQNTQGVTEVEITINIPATVGRSSKCEIPLEDIKISGRHCRFLLKSDRLEITDLDSKNGTYLNGIRIEQSEVFIGDEVKIGESTIHLHEKKMSRESVDILTFPGPFKDRISHELRADFTGARIQNQLEKKNPSQSKSTKTVFHGKEIELRRKMKSNYKLSKQEIHAQNKSVSLISNFFDIFFSLAVIAIPIAGIYYYQLLPLDKTQKLFITVIIESFFLSLFMYANFRLTKFTIGERISGIEDIYKRQ
jgi:hypothetical protein